VSIRCSSSRSPRGSRAAATWPTPGRTPLRHATLVVVCVLAVACTGRTGTPVSHRDQQPAGAWPTHGWRTAAPAEEGMDPKGLAIIDDDAGGVYPGLRSVLVVRHGVLVFEHYYRGATRPPTSTSGR
jgi:hypothetical protein